MGIIISQSEISNQDFWFLSANRMKGGLLFYGCFHK